MKREIKFLFAFLSFYLVFSFPIRADISSSYYTFSTQLAQYRHTNPTPAIRNSTIQALTADFTYTFDCETNSFIFTTKINFPYDSYHWKHEKIVVYNKSPSAYQFSIEGQHQVTLNVYKDGKEYAVNKNINYTASVTPNLGIDKTLCGGETLLLAPKILPGTALRWSTGSTSPTLLITKPGTYWVEATRGNCTIRDEVVISTTGCQMALTIPNIITPNADGRNDVFYIEELAGLVPSGKANTWELAVFNRWGIKVYQAAPYKNNWGGETLQNDTYFYILTNKDQKQTYKGWLEILR